MIYSKEARNKIYEGVQELVDSVAITIGPRGANVAITDPNGAPNIANDAGTIAQAILEESEKKTPKDPYKHAGIQIGHEVVEQTGRVAGDSRTTCALMLGSMLKEAFDHVDTGVNAWDIRKGIEKATADSIGLMKTYSRPIKNKAELIHIASISAESEPLGKLVAETVTAVGLQGSVKVEQMDKVGIENEIVQGMEIESGYMSSTAPMNRKDVELSYEQTPVLVSMKRLVNIEDIRPIVEEVQEQGYSALTIITDTLEGGAYSYVSLNGSQGRFNFVVVKAPDIGDHKLGVMEDIACFVGATLITDDIKITADKLGFVDRVISNLQTTVLYGGHGKHKDISNRVSYLSQIKKGTLDHIKERIDKRISNLLGAKAFIRVGASSEREVSYLKLKVSDAINATRGALEEGVVPGGGATLAKVGRELRKSLSTLSGGERVGYELVLNALEKPLRQIAINAHEDDGVIVEKVIKSKRNGGYDAKNNIIVPDMFKAGIVNQFKGERVAIQHAASATAISATIGGAIDISNN